MPKPAKSLPQTMGEIAELQLGNLSVETANLLRMWLEYKALQKESERFVGDKGALKPKLGMLLLADQDVKVFDAVTHEVVVERITRDLRKPDMRALTALVKSKNVKLPPEAYEQTVRGEYIAQAIAAGEITEDDVKACLTGSISKYVTCNLRKKGEVED
jgi:hypothetical protein